MFLDTLGISARQVRTVTEKITDEGTLEKDARGGRPRQLSLNDKRVREEVKAHIERFPKMESHYCRSTSSSQYLSDLNIATMYELYKEEHPDGASLSLYTKVFQSMNLKFHTPKKDQCGVCFNFHEASEDEKEGLQQDYERHVAEKERVREVKRELTASPAESPSTVTAAFDLQQVIYLPQSKRSEIFYKRRLACYNFTIYDIANGDGHCYLAHEGLTKRGANEIASYIYDFLKQKDTDEVKEVNFFCDGCPGQNKNTIIPSMIHWFVRHSVNVEVVSIYFFETNHGQCEGDAMHSVIERKLRKAEKIFLPSQLGTLLRTTRKHAKGSKARRPYNVYEVSPNDILDWKAHSTSIGFLRLRQSDEGKPINWKDFVAVRVKKSAPEKLFMKMSHLEDTFSEITLAQGRKHSLSTNMPDLAYDATTRPKLSEDKYGDLVKLNEGSNPVIKHPDHIQFYRLLPH